MAKIRSGTDSTELTVDSVSKSARTTLYDSTGTETTDPITHNLQVNLHDAEGREIGSVVDSDGDSALDVAVIQNVVVSTVNSTVAPLASGQVWEGTGESTLGVIMIQVNVYTDKRHSLVVEQSMDNTHWDLSTLPIVVSAGAGIARNIIATASYYRVRITNDSGENSAVLRLQTALCPIAGNIQSPIKQTLCLAWIEQSGTANQESELANFTSGSLAGVVISPDTNFTVPAGRILTISGVNIYIKSTSTDINLGTFNIRTSPPGEPITNESPVEFSVTIPGSIAATTAAGSGNTQWCALPQPITVVGGSSIAFTWKTSGNTCKVGMTIMGFVE